MCDVCGCGENHGIPKVEDTKRKVVSVKKNLLEENERIALSNRRHFDEKGITVFNLISSPGSGKTTLLEKTIDALGKDLRIGVLEGDIETERDAERIRKRGALAVQLTTGGACHLEAPLVHKGFHVIEKLAGDDGLDVLFIENVGNLVCPASFYLGEHLRVVLVSVPEGSDKPAKYPKAFKTSQVFIVTKIDLLDFFDFDLDRVIEEALSINPSLKVFAVSAKTGEGMNEWFDFVRESVRSRKSVQSV